jgi:hypothetical protein
MMIIFALYQDARLWEIKVDLVFMHLAHELVRDVRTIVDQYTTLVQCFDELQFQLRLIQDLVTILIFPRSDLECIVGEPTVLTENLVLVLLHVQIAITERAVANFALKYDVPDRLYSISLFIIQKRIEVCLVADACTRIILKVIHVRVLVVME